MTTAEKTFRTDLSKGFYVLNILVKNLQSNFLVSLSYDEKLLWVKANIYRNLPECDCEQHNLYLF